MDKLEQKLCLYPQLRKTITPELFGNEIRFRYRVTQDDEGIIMPREVLKEIIRAIPRTEAFRYHYDSSAEAQQNEGGIYPSGILSYSGRYNCYSRRGSC
jgi:hypothetical protein